MRVTALVRAAPTSIEPSDQLAPAPASGPGPNLFAPLALHSSDGIARRGLASMGQCRGVAASRPFLVRRRPYPPQLDGKAIGSGVGSIFVGGCRHLNGLTKGDSEVW
jgi:hypothetical protein